MEIKIAITFTFGSHESTFFQSKKKTFQSKANRSLSQVNKFDHV